MQSACHVYHVHMKAWPHAIQALLHFPSSNTVGHLVRKLLVWREYHTLKLSRYTMHVNA